MNQWLLLALIALFFWGITGITQKLSTNNFSSTACFVWFSAAFVPISIVLWLWRPVSLPSGLGVFALIALGGFLNGLGAWTSFAALEKGGKASVVIPLVYVYPLLTVLGAWLLLGEHVTFRQMAGIFLAVVSVYLLSQEAPPDDNTGRSV